MTTIALPLKRRRRHVQAEPERSPMIELENISWETYERLLKDTAHQHISITYDQGRMFLMSPLPEHQRAKKLLGQLVEAATLERGIRRASLGSTTWRKQRKLIGLEPDECYYIQNEAKVRGRDDIDLKYDPPPDLAIEVDITHKAPGDNQFTRSLAFQKFGDTTDTKSNFICLAGWQIQHHSSQPSASISLHRRRLAICQDASNHR
jgi:Uma2 family endonuclease